MREERSPMTVIEVTNTEPKDQPYLSQLMKKLIGNRYCLELLRFFVAHPNGRFSRLAITHAIDDNGSKRETEEALKQMASDGIIQINIENDISFYRLTREEPIRQIILEMAEFDRRHWQMVLEHM
jgi:hypothetical protein